MKTVTTNTTYGPFYEHKGLFSFFLIFRSVFVFSLVYFRLESDFYEEFVGTKTVLDKNAVKIVYVE